MRPCFVSEKATFRYAFSEVATSTPVIGRRRIAARRADERRESPHRLYRQADAPYALDAAKQFDCAWDSIAQIKWFGISECAKKMNIGKT